MSIVFYSWQSDLPNATNRGFIQKALENAAKAIRADDSIEVEPVVDRDTFGVPGAPNIADTILAKIEAAQVFVCDVSIINNLQGERVDDSKKSRPTPNPNVLIELGYALKALSGGQILMVMNTAYGGPELLPFDLKMNRVTQYRMPQENENRAKERKVLEMKLEEGLHIILAGLGDSTGEPREETLDEKTARLKRERDFERFREQFLGIDGEGVEAASEEAERLFHELERLTEAIRDSGILIQMKPVQDTGTRRRRTDTITSWPYRLQIRWYCHAVNSLTDSFLSIKLQKQDPEERYAEKFDTLLDSEYNFDMRTPGELGWRREGGDFYTTEELAESHMHEFMDCLLDK